MNYPSSERTLLAVADPRSAGYAKAARYIVPRGADRAFSGRDALDTEVRETGDAILRAQGRGNVEIGDTLRARYVGLALLASYYAHLAQKGRGVEVHPGQCAFLAVIGASAIRTEFGTGSTNRARAANIEVEPDLAPGAIGSIGRKDIALEAVRSACQALVVD